MMVAKSAFSNEVLPGPPGKRVSPVNSSGVPSTVKHIEPGVWPGVAMVPMPQPADLQHRAVLEDLVVGGEHAGVGGGDGHVDPGVAHGLDRLDVVPVAVGLDHLAHAEGSAQLEEFVVLVGRVDRGGTRPSPAAHDVDVVVDGPTTRRWTSTQRVVVVAVPMTSGTDRPAAPGPGSRPARAARPDRPRSGPEADRTTLVATAVQWRLW